MTDSPGLIGRHRVGVRGTPLGIAQPVIVRRPFEDPEPETRAPKSAEEIAADAAAWRDQQPTTTECLFCDWTFTGTAADGRDEAREHREREHPVAAQRRSRGRKRLVSRQHRTDADNERAAIEAAEARRLRAEREDAERLAKIERGRARDALAAMDAGDPRQPEPEPEPGPVEPAPDAEASTVDAGDGASGPTKGDTVATIAEQFNLKKFGRGYVWTREAMIEAVRAFAATHDGEPPSAEASKREPVGMLPSTKSAASEFGDWNGLVVAAGLTPKTQSGQKAAEQEEPAPRPEPAQLPEPTPSCELVVVETELRDPIRTADIPYDADILEEEADFLRERADALDAIAAGVRQLALASRRDEGEEELAA